MLFRRMSMIAGLMALTLGSLPVLAQSNTDCNGTLRENHQTQRRQGNGNSNNSQGVRRQDNGNNSQGVRRQDNGNNPQGVRRQDNGNNSQGVRR